MIDDLDEVLRQLLIREIPIKNGEVDIAFDQPSREWSAKLSRPTLNLFLYDARENQKLRQTQPMWEVERQQNNTAVRHRRPARLDLHYMITAWAADPEDGPNRDGSLSLSPPAARAAAREPSGPAGAHPGCRRSVR
jgi:hypothetical protein